MRPQLIISDWNGTLITDLDDKPVLKQIAVDELGYAARHLRLGRVGQLALTKRRLEKMVKQYRESPDAQGELLRKMFELYGREVIEGIPRSRIRRSEAIYAMEAVKRLDPIYEEFLRIATIPRGIVTSAVRDGVFAVLRASRKDYMNFAGVNGSEIYYDDTKEEMATGIKLKNHGDKHRTIEEIINFRRIPQESVVFMSDNALDEPCVHVVGRFVVPPLATDAYRQHMARTYGSKVRTPTRDGIEVYRALTTD